MVCVRFMELDVWSDITRMSDESGSVDMRIDAQHPSHTPALDHEIEFLRRLLLLLDPVSMLWLAVATRRRELLRRRMSDELRSVLLVDPTSVIDL